MVTDTEGLGYNGTARTRADREGFDCAATSKVDSQPQHQGHERKGEKLRGRTPRLTKVPEAVPEALVMRAEDEMGDEMKDETTERNPRTPCTALLDLRISPRTPCTALLELRILVRSNQKGQARSGRRQRERGLKEKGAQERLLRNEQGRRPSTQALPRSKDSARKLLRGKSQAPSRFVRGGNSSVEEVPVLNKQAEGAEEGRC